MSTPPTGSPANKTWLITGCSTGFGRVLAERALARGDTVAVTARSLDAIRDIVTRDPQHAHPFALDVTDAAQVMQVVTAAEQALGRIDVLVNNAGYVLTGGVEEVSPAEARAIFDTNFFGAVAMMQAVLPGMRRRRAGHILNISSMGGISGGVGMGFYGATKFALSGVSESLAREVTPLGIRVTVVEPGGHRTGAIKNVRKAAHTIDDYADTVGRQRQRMIDIAGREDGDPGLAAAAMIAIVDAAEPPLHLLLGRDALTRAEAKIAALSSDIRAWKHLTLSTAVGGAKAADS